MHVVHPHLPRAVIVSLAAALATIVIMMALAARLGDVQLSQNQPASPAVTHGAPQLTARLTAPAAPRRCLAVGPAEPNRPWWESDPRFSDRFKEV